jgi:hypothetical protein
MFWTIAWAAFKAIISGEIASWYHAHEEKKQAQGIANAPLTNKEEADNFGNWQ